MTNLDWLAEHLIELIDKYPDQWVVISDNQVIWSCAELYPIVDKTVFEGSLPGQEPPLVTHIPKEVNLDHYVFSSV